MGGFRIAGGVAPMASRPNESQKVKRKVVSERATVWLIAWELGESLSLRRNKPVCSLSVCAFECRVW